MRGQAWCTRWPSSVGHWNASRLGYRRLLGILPGDSWRWSPQNANETTVAVGSEYTDAYDFDVLSHPSLLVDHRFKVDGDNAATDVAVTVDITTAGARFGWVYNGVHGTGSAFPRPRMWSRYTADDEVTISRGYSGQNSQLGSKVSTLVV
ncbi:MULTISPECIES: hypothetical protein [unclassified Lentimonas]|uniref:hypothetical protein n=1 Tax=unclassified Lentimonas TaxID=2630993 RepID=UPI001328F0EB|nr:MULTISPECIES: hypothetical protein [unclassified Lentimonas]CAA6689995.1 Unannotated [Lentimonas sp. CC10]CAA6691070.1 Unannotated [Lentimonas sp. CC19]